MQTILVTGNTDKAREASSILGCQVTCLSLDLPEIQGDAEEIIRDKCRRAYDLLPTEMRNANTIMCVEDVSLCIDMLDGMPGPYIKWFLKALGTKGISRVCLGSKATAECRIAYTPTSRYDPKIILGSTDGVISWPSRRDGFGYDPIFHPTMSTCTYADMDQASKNAISERSQAYTTLKYMLQHQ